jgi:hypothetical protein
MIGKLVTIFISDPVLNIFWIKVPEKAGKEFIIDIGSFALMSENFFYQQDIFYG